MVEKINIEIGLVGDEEIKRKLSETASSFKTATSDISKLGNTMAEALNGAAAAAKKFGALTNDLAGVESRIRAVNARARDTGTTFAAMAANFSQAGIAASNLGASVEAAGTAFVGLGRVAGVAGTAIVAAGTLIVRSILAMTTEFNKANAAAIRLGITFKQFDTASKALERIGVAGADAAKAIGGLQSFLDKINLERVQQAARDVQAMGRFAAMGSDKLKFLQEMAQGIGPAADAAREKLQQLEQVNPFKALSESMGPVQRFLADMGLSLDQFKAKAGEVDTLMPQIIAKFKQMPDGVERTAIAQALLKDGAVAVIQALQAEERTATDAAGQIAQAITRLQTAWTNLMAGQPLISLISPEIVSMIDAITTAIGTLQQAVTNFTWETFKAATIACFEVINGLISGFTLAGMLQWIAKAIVGWTDLAGVIGKVIDVFLRLIGLREKAGGTPLPGGAPIGGPGGGIGGGFAGGGLMGGRGTATSDSNLAWLSRGEFVVNAAAVRHFGPAFFAALNKFRMPAGAISGGNRFAAGGEVGFKRAGSIQDIVQAVNDLAKSITEAFNVVAREKTLTDGINTILGRIDAGVERILNKISNPKASPGPGSTEAERIRDRYGLSFASGGLLGGRGTGTSDSNLAWLSRGEHVMPAYAVRQPGVLAFLEALRHSGGNLAAVLDGMGRFALGGMMPRSIPAFAAGGLNGGNNVTIQFPGLPPISGLRASSDVVDDLRKAAVLAQVRSGGRKPSRYF